MSLPPTLTPALYDHPELGQLIAVAALAPQFRAMVNEMIACEEMRCVAHHQQHRYVLLSESEPYSPVDLDEVFADTMLPPDPSFSTFSVLAQLRTSKTIPAIRLHFAELARTFGTPMGDRVASSNPFVPGLVPLNFSRLWSDVAFVGANVAGGAEAEKVREAHRKLASSAGTDAIDEEVARFHKLQLSIAAPELAEKFDWIWSAGRGRLFIPQDKEKEALDILRALTLTFSGYRGDPEGSEGPRYLMGQYLRVAKLEQVASACPI